MKQLAKQSNPKKIFIKATKHQRRSAGCVAAVIFLLILWVALIGRGFLRTPLIFGGCAFNDRYDLPCPACGMTTSIEAFCRGEILKAFYIQPAAAVIVCLLIAGFVLSLLAAGFGVNFSFVDNLLWHPNIWWYILTGFIAVLVFGWIITLTRAIA